MSACMCVTVLNAEVSVFSFDCDCRMLLPLLGAYERLLVCVCVCVCVFGMVFGNDKHQQRVSRNMSQLTSGYVD